MGIADLPRPVGYGARPGGPVVPEPGEVGYRRGHLIHVLAAELMYRAWTRNDRAAAATEATSAAVNALFAHAWEASDGWSFAQSGAAAGSFTCTWQRTGEQLTLEGNDGTGAPFYYVRQVTFQPQSQY